MSEEVTNQDPVENTETTSQQPEAVNLTVQDLASLKSIIDVAAQRGAFQPKEMTAVGTVYNKLSSFLDEIAKQTPSQQG